MSTIILNFAHPLTEAHREQAGRLRPGLERSRVIDLPVHFTEETPYEEQVAALIERAGLTAREWQTLPLIINPPGYAPIAAILLAYLHGLRGGFPDLLRIARDADGAYVVAEIVKLQSVRESGRVARVR
jgi:hypothetical protein